MLNYKGADIMIQTYRFMFQFVMRYKGNWYQAHNIITPQKGQKKLTVLEVVDCIDMMQDMAVASVEQIIRNENPDYKPTKEQLAGQEVVDVLEKANKTIN